MPNGVMPKQAVRQLLAEGFIKGVDEKYLNPASLDLPLSKEAYRIESIFMLRRGEKVRDMLSVVGATPHDLLQPLEFGTTYIIRIEGDWRLPKNVRAFGNPKSSTGRTRVFCRLVADGVAMYDALIRGWSGELWLIVRPDSFPVLVHPGLPLAQLRFVYEKSFLNPIQTEGAIRGSGLLFAGNGGRKLEYDEVQRHEGSLALSIYVGEGMGYECRGRRTVLDLSKTGHYEPSDFFEPVQMRNDSLFLRKDQFYILSTDEGVMVPPHMAAELRAIEDRLGEFRSHAAGFIDSGWGWRADGTNLGRRITLEVIPFEDMLIRAGQPIALLRYELMNEEPDVPYDAANSNYVNQTGAELSKHFKKAA